MEDFGDFANEVTAWEGVASYVGKNVRWFDFDSECAAVIGLCYYSGGVLGGVAAAEVVAADV